MEENSEKRGLRSYFDWQGIKSYIKELLSLRNDTDHLATIESIKKSIEFKGVNVWILAFAVIVASVGLNVNSTAVIIGAMLISPLMGPINGIGLSVGISDNELLRKSIVNYLTMVTISFVASSLYFLLSPLGDAQSELLARTSPTIFDVLIAFFGGMAGIVAMSRKSQPFTVISGVAIATALMPPLCTAGYGLATLQGKFLFGAFYLFFINSFFIAFATFIMVRYLNFPRKTYLDAKRSKRVKNSIMFFTIIVMVPSIITAFNVVRESNFNTHSNKFISELQEDKVCEGVQIINVKKEWGRKQSTINISTVGKELSDEDLVYIEKMMYKMGLEDVKLSVKQTGVQSMEISPEMLSDLLSKKEDEIYGLREEISSLKNNQFAYKQDIETSVQIAKEISIQYPFVDQFSISNNFYVNSTTFSVDTLMTINVIWKEVPTEVEKSKFVSWLKVRLNNKRIKLVEE